MKTKMTWMAVLAAGALWAAAPKFPEVPPEALQSLKGERSKKPIPIRSGVVFVNGRYLPNQPTPYVVWRRGTAIYIGDVQVTGQIVPWSVFAATKDESTRRYHLKRIMDYRTDVDRRLRRGEILFFGANYSMLHVEERLGLSLMTILPEALRKSSDATDLHSRLRAAGITYLSQTICEDLFANQNTSFEIESRGRMMKSDADVLNIINDGAQGVVR